MSYPNFNKDVRKVKIVIVIGFIFNAMLLFGCGVAIHKAANTDNVSGSGYSGSAKLPELL